MKPLSAAIFALSGAVCGAIGEAWHMHDDTDYPPELGFGVALIGLALFALLYAGEIYCCAAALQYLHRDSERIAAYAICAIVGAPFWPIMLYVQRVSTEILLLPDSMWWIESLLLCCLSFEMIRLAHKLSRHLIGRASKGKDASIGR